MNDNEFRQQLEADAANSRPGVTGLPENLSQILDGLSAERIPFGRTHLAFAALDIYLMIAADIYGRKGTIFGLARQPSYLTIACGSQIVTCTHYLNLAAIGFRFQGFGLDPAWTPIIDDGPLAVGYKWAPKPGHSMMDDRREIQDQVINRIVKFLKAK